MQCARGQEILLTDKSYFIFRWLLSLVDSFYIYKTSLGSIKYVSENWAGYSSLVVRVQDGGLGVLNFIFTSTTVSWLSVIWQKSKWLSFSCSSETQKQTKPWIFSPFSKHLILVSLIFPFLLEDHAMYKIDIICTSFKTSLNLKENVKDRTNPNEKFRAVIFDLCSE